MPKLAEPDIYPSRLESDAHFIDRQDPVVYPGGPVEGRLATEDLEQFEANGYLFVEGLLQPYEVRQFTTEARRLASASYMQDSVELISERDNEEVRSIFSVHRLSRVFEWLACDTRILDVARQILGSEVYLHQSRVNLKPGFQGKEFYWHSDFETWHVEDGMPRMRALSASIALTDNYEFNGPLMLIPGSHKTFVPCVGRTPKNHHLSSLKKQEYGVPDNANLKRLADRGGIVAPTGGAGAVVFFDCNMMHGSNSNISPFARSNVFFVYNSVENRLQDPQHGLKPRPEHIASRELMEALTPLARK